jgi:hypothetical protein
MSQRVNLSGEVKSATDGAVAKASLNRAMELLGLDTKPGELPMGRLKRG